MYNTQSMTAGAPNGQLGRRLSRALAVGLCLSLGALFVEVFFEGWITTVLGAKHINSAGDRVVDPVVWPKTVKNTLYFLLLALIAAKYTVDRRWHTLLTKVDLALAVLGLILVATALYGRSAPTVAGAALFVYFRGAIAFYALRALDPSPRTVRRLVWLTGGLIAVNAAIAVWQMFVGYGSYRTLGWVDLTWARINRAHALLPFPNDLGHVAGLMLLGLVAWIVARQRVKARWWLLFALVAVGLGASQSRESTIGVVFGAILIAGLCRERYRRVLIAVGLVLVAAAAPLAFSPSNRAEWGRRLSGVVNAFETPSGSEPGKSGPEPGKQGSTSPPAAADLGVCEKDPDAAGCEESYVPPPREIRVLYYQQGLRLWAHEPILGYGIGHFGGIVAYRTNPDWNLDHRFDKGGGFDKYGFRAKTVDSFWLHLLVEAGALGLAGYLAWMYLLAAPLAGAARRRAGSADDTVNPFFYWAPAAVLFGFLIAFLSPSLEDPLFAPLMFSILGVAWALLARRPTVSPAAAQAVATDGAVVRSASDGPTVTNDPTVTNGNQTRSANDDIHIR